MGNSLATVFGTLVGIYYKLLEKAGNLTSKKNSSFQSEILLKDEENQAGKMFLYIDLLSNEEIKNIIKNRKNDELKNEYHLIKNNDEHLYKNNINDEIEDLQNEIDRIQIQNYSNNYINIEELKVQILEKTII